MRAEILAKPRHLDKPARDEAGASAVAKPESIADTARDSDDVFIGTRNLRADDVAAGIGFDILREKS